MTDLPMDDQAFRDLLLDDLSRVDVGGVDHAWAGHVRTVRRLRRRNRVRVAAMAAALVLVASTAGRSTVSLGGAALADVARSVFDATVDKTVDVIVEKVDDAVGARQTASAGHGDIDESNAFWVDIRWAHDRLNDAVGWDQWDPAALDGVADRLRAASARDPSLGGKATEAADLVERAVRERDREAAVLAHRKVAEIEIELAGRS
jgi:hypothetical protein